MKKITKPTREIETRKSSRVHFLNLIIVVVLTGAFAFLAPEHAHADLPTTWCSHRGAVRRDVDVNGDGQLDALCYDSRGSKWVALRESGVLTERWANDTIRFCSHPGAVLFLGDVNGDRRADLICKDTRHIWVDYGASDFYQGVDFYLDTVWCTHTGAVFFVGDQNNDGRDDLVCRSRDSFHFIDYADSAGRFGGTDASGLAPDFEIINIIRLDTGVATVHRMTIRNNGTNGRAEYFGCSSSDLELATVVLIPSGATRNVEIQLMRDPDTVTCWVRGRGADGSSELFTSNNRLTKRIR